MSAPDDNTDDLTDDEKTSPREKPMGFWDHLEELRATIVKSLIVFIIFAVLIAYYLPEFNGLLIRPLHKTQADYPTLDLALRNISVVESFNVIIQVCVFGGLALAVPFILFFIGQFVSPALTQKELKTVLPMCISAMVLFICGAAFSYFFLVPSTLDMSVKSSLLLDQKPQWTAASYYSTLMWLVGGVGGAFEFPLLIILLIWLGIMSTAFLKKYRRHAIVVIFIIAALVTPTPDPLTQSVFAAPLYLLYEAAIIVGRSIEKKRDRQLLG